MNGIFYGWDGCLKKLFSLLVIIGFILINPGTANSKSINSYPDFIRMIDEHGAVMLLIDPETGLIRFANNAASAFYGYPKEQLQLMKITQINTLSPEKTAAEMKAAKEELRNYFVFNHRLANGEIRTVEVFSYPVNVGENNLLYSVIHDVTPKTIIEEKEEKMTTTVYIAGSIVILFLLLFTSLLFKSRKKIRASKEEIENFNALRKTFMDALDSLIYLKDENLNYVFVNRFFEAFHNKKAEQIIGLNDFDLTKHAFAEKSRKTDLEVLEKGSLVIDEVEWNSRIYKTTKFPVKMLSGRIGVGAYVQEITKERENEKRKEKTLYRHMILVDMLSHRFKGKREQLDYVLNEALKLTESQYGYIYLYDEEKKEFILNSWTKGVMEECTVVQKQTKYQLEETGIWGEVVRQRKPILVNDFGQPNPLKKGYPKGHVELKKFMSVPIFFEDKIVAVMGLANKHSDYDESDVYEIILLMSGIWNAVKRREALENLSYERNKYLQTLISIGDGVMVVDKNGKIEMLNHFAERLTGWSENEAKGKHYKEVLILFQENPNHVINDPIEKVFTTNIIQKYDDYQVLTSKDGTSYYIENSAAPIKDYSNTTVGVVLVFRDVTEKKEHRRKIEYLSFHDSLTGLYNRRFFEEEMNRLDTERNLPISIIMGDVNGLKLTNDIFGHEFGDMLLESVAKVLRKVCRADDIIARWGGDEFVLLLSQTNFEEAEKIVARIKGEFAKEQIKAIKGSISVGFDVKQNLTEDIAQILDNAEEKMYSAKTIERDSIQSSVLDAIIRMLHKGSAREKEHSVRVSELCQGLGRALSFSDVDIRKLKDAGYFHDIGKIVLNPKLLSKNQLFTKEELSEIRKHAIVGYRILNSFYETIYIAEYVLAHHERWDGNGYPKGLKGEEIPMLSRIIAVVDIYDRMIHSIDNNKTMSKEEAVKAIRENAGKYLDHEIVEKFISMLVTKQMT